MTAVAPNAPLLPAAVREAISEGLGEREFSRWALETLVLQAVDDNLLSTGAAAEALGLGYFQILALIKERGIPLRMSEEDMARDREDLLRMFPDLGPR